MKITLVNMPFSNWSRPSFALSQLQSQINQRFGERVDCSVVNLNVALADRMGVELYEEICENLTHLYSGVGDWLFRDVAFPDAPDNTDLYFSRFYREPSWREFPPKILEFKKRVPGLLAELVEEHRLADADLVGFTSMFAQTVPSIACANEIKARRADTVVVMGGANCEAPMGNVYAENVPALDYVFSGPALHSFAGFVDLFLEGRVEQAVALPGVLSRETARRPGRLTTIGKDRDINDQILPDYTNFRSAIEANPALVREGNSELTLFFETSRGCWWGARSHCTFCGLNGQSMEYRSLNPEAAVQLFEGLFEHAPWCKTFYCTDNVMPKNYPREVFERLNPPPGVQIYYEIKLPVSRADLQRMVKGGVTIVQPGIEALATSTLQLMRKGISAFQNLQFLKNCVEFGISPEWNLLIGFPGEDPAVYTKYLRDLPLLHHLPPPQGVFPVRFDRFSPYFTDRLDYGLDLVPMASYELIYPFERQQIDQLAYFFADRAIGDYALNAYQAHGPLLAAVREWQRNYESAVTLRLAGDSPHLTDTRPGRSSGLLDEEDVTLLRRLDSPQRLERLAREWPSGPDDLRARIDGLRERGLLFEEGDQLISLVPGQVATREGASTIVQTTLRHHD